TVPRDAVGAGDKLGAWSGRALLRNRLQALANLLGVAAEVVEARECGQRLQAEDALEQRGCPVPHGARAVRVAARLRDEAPLDQARNDGIHPPAANAGDLRTRDR